MISRAASILASISTLCPVVGLSAQIPDLSGLSSSPTSSAVPGLTHPAPDAPGFDTALETLEEALALYRDDEFSAAADVYLSLTETVPTLSEWAPMFAAESLAELGDTSAVDELVATLAPGSEVRQGWGWLFQARALEVAAAPERAAAVAMAATMGTRVGPTASLRWQRAGELALQAGDTVGARTALHRAMTSGKGDRFAVRAADALASLPDLTAEERYGVARTRVRQNEIGKAIPGLEVMSEVAGLSASERQQSRLDLMRAYFTARRYGDAETLAAEVLEDSAASDAVRARAAYWLGRSLYRQGHVETGRATLESVALRFPGQRASADALWVLADLEDDANRMVAAREYYHQILDVAPRSSRADVASMRLGSTDYLAGNFDDAQLVFDRRREEAGSSSARQQAAYWSGLAFESMGQPEQALLRFLEAYSEEPLTYYGAQAATRTGAPLLAADLPPGPQNGSSVRDDELTNAVLRLRVHMRVPTPGSFGYELERLKAHFAARTGGSYALAEVLIEGGLPIQGIVLGREIQRRTDGWNLRLLRIVYPFPHRELIVREADRRGVNPYFAAGLIRQESMFDEDIKSRAGAIGMMQVMPATGKELANALDIRPFSTIRLTEADINVQLGMTFLSEMLRRYDGEILDALVAYNAGPTRIRRWREYPEYEDLDVFMERIPFGETREYVKVVQKNALIYESLYGCGQGEPCLGVVPGPLQGQRESSSEAQSLSR